MKIDKFLSRSTLIILLGWIAYGFYSREKLINNSRITTGKVTGCHFIVKSSGGIGIEYMYQVGSHVCKRSNTRKDLSLTTCKDHFVGKSFPVAYHPVDNDLSWLLLTPEEFKGINLTYPDSLLWVLAYLK